MLHWVVRVCRHAKLLAPSGFLFLNGFMKRRMLWRALCGVVITLQQEHFWKQHTNTDLRRDILYVSILRQIHSKIWTLSCVQKCPLLVVFGQHAVKIGALLQIAWVYLWRFSPSFQVYIHVNSNPGALEKISCDHLRKMKNCKQSLITISERRTALDHLVFPDQGLPSACHRWRRQEG